jgi:hypothetical protein
MARNTTTTETDGVGAVAAVRRAVAGVHWEGVAAAVDRDGYAVTATPLLDEATARELRDGFDDDARFRSTIDMARLRYGSGTYRYYRHPLPPVVAALRTATYAPLASLANAWAARLGTEPVPPTLAGLVDRCHAAGQDKPTPLVLRYGPGDWNALHQDIYGDVAFPLQLAVALTAPGVDFTGGENLLVEQRPRAQSRGVAVTIPLGHGMVFPNRYRPAAGARGDHRLNVRHGVSTVHSGERVTLGVIYHDAR